MHWDRSSARRMPKMKAIFKAYGRQQCSNRQLTGNVLESARENNLFSRDNLKQAAKNVGLKQMSKSLPF